MNTLRYFASANPTSVISATPDPFPVPNGSEHLDRVDAGMQATLAFPGDVVGTLTCHHRVPSGPLRLYLVPILPEMSLTVQCENGELEVFNHIKSTTYHYIKVSVKTGKEGKERKSRIEKVYKPTQPGQKGEDWWSRYAVFAVDVCAHGR